MNIQTLSIITGTAACNAKCPYCISKMTGTAQVGEKLNDINWNNFDKAARLAQLNKVSSILLTGKGEPTIYPRQITQYLKHLQKYNFPIIELQTNGILLEQDQYLKHLTEWHSLGLGIIAISIVHYNPQKNKKIYTPHMQGYVDLPKLVEKLHKIGFSVRFVCTLLKGYTDSPQEVQKLAEYTTKLNVEQLTLRPVNRPKKSACKKVYDQTQKYLLTNKDKKNIKNFLETKGNLLVTFGHGAQIYDYKGQNICLTDSLTIKPKTTDIRQAIFFPNGHLYFDWQYKGAIIF